MPLVHDPTECTEETMLDLLAWIRTLTDFRRKTTNNEESESIISVCTSNPQRDEGMQKTTSSAYRLECTCYHCRSVV
jgi:hypothetical protein